MVNEITMYFRISQGNIKTNYYSSTFKKFVRIPEIYSFIRLDPNCVLRIRYNPKVKPEVNDERDVYLSLLRSVEESEPATVQDLSRIIRNGGYTNYIKELEAKCS